MKRSGMRERHFPDFATAPSGLQKKRKTQGRESMELRPAGSTPSRRMSADWFTGTVWQDPIIEAPAPARLRAALVTFEAGARTAWHIHPLGQTLYVVSGVGRADLWR